MDSRKKKTVLTPSDISPVDRGLRYKKIWRSIAYIIILIIIVLSLIPHPERLAPFSASDKLLHAMAYAFTMLWFGFCFKRDKLLPIGAGLILLGVALEVAQGQTGYRTMSFHDIIANCVGVLFGLLLAFSRLSNALMYFEYKFFK